MKDLPYHRGFLVDHLPASGATTVGFGDIPIAVGEEAEHADGARAGSMTFAPATTREEFGALILGDHALHLQ